MNESAEIKRKLNEIELKLNEIKMIMTRDWDDQGYSNFLDGVLDDMYLQLEQFIDGYPCGYEDVFNPDDGLDETRRVLESITYPTEQKEI